MSLKHFSHEHPLVFFTQTQSHCSISNEPVDKNEKCNANGNASEVEVEEVCLYCSGCKQLLDGPSYYYCTESDCKFYLHEKCAHLDQKKIKHPFHHKHPLKLQQNSPYASPIVCICNFCRTPCEGFVYHCSFCKFDLHVKCFTVGIKLLSPKLFPHFGHDHHLIFVENHNNEVKVPCSVCEDSLLGSIYGCFDCGFYLHESCANLPGEINHPNFHPEHPLKLVPKSPYSPSIICVCNFCNIRCRGFVYHCSSCDFDLHVKCALHPQFFNAGRFPQLKYFGHKHLLIFVEKHTYEVEDSCFLCEESLSGPIYSCFDCGFHLDKKCFELSSVTMINHHPFHRKHPLGIVDKTPNPADKDTCNFCQNPLRTPFFHCASCGYNLHIKCALRVPLNPGNIVEEIQHFSHEAHPLMLIEEHNLRGLLCRGCMEELSVGPIYSCFDCMFHLHKNCAELLPEIQHPSHRRHSLVLLPNLPTSPKEGYSEGFVYYCSECKFWSMAKDTFMFPSGTLENHDHQHSFACVSRPISFICDFCGTSSYRNESPYICPPCNLVVHKDCISSNSFPSSIKIARHPHRMPHIYYLYEKTFKNWECKICHEEVNTEHGSYYCQGCSYISHVRCATDPYIWDRNANLDDEDQNASRSLITRVIEVIKDGDEEIATKIQHSFHEHELSLTRIPKDDVPLNQDHDKSCDGCMKPISTPFYSCQNCEFFLHKSCAELPERKQVPLHKHPLSLHKPHPANKLSNCKTCLSFHHGFIYRCDRCKISKNNEWECEFDVDIQCSLLPDTLKHGSHEHELFLDHRYESSCSGCASHIPSRTGAYRCKKHCKFVLDFKCITLPLVAWYKCDRHPLALTYTDNSDPNQHYCDICEEERNPEHWFYLCKDCDNAAHIECILGEVPHVKSGKMYKVSVHPHPLVFVKKIWNLPLCKECGTLCKVQFLECRSTGCDYTIHWRCKGDDASEMQLYNNDYSEMQSDIDALELQSLLLWLYDNHS